MFSSHLGIFFVKLPFQVHFYIGRKYCKSGEWKFDLNDQKEVMANSKIWGSLQPQSHLNEAKT